MSFAEVFQPLAARFGTALIALDAAKKDRNQKLAALSAASDAVTIAQQEVDQIMAAVQALVADVSDEDGYTYVEPAPAPVALPAPVEAPAPEVPADVFTTPE